MQQTRECWALKEQSTHCYRPWKPVFLISFSLWAMCSHMNTHFSSKQQFCLFYMRFLYFRFFSVFFLLLCNLYKHVYMSVYIRRLDLHRDFYLCCWSLIFICVHCPDRSFPSLLLALCLFLCKSIESSEKPESDSLFLYAYLADKTNY